MIDFDFTVIPQGYYCYAGKTKCPFWSKDETKPEQMNGHCSYLDLGDWEIKDFGLLWDQVKECNVNRNYVEDAGMATSPIGKIHQDLINQLDYGIRLNRTHYLYRRIHEFNRVSNYQFRLQSALL